MAKISAYGEHEVARWRQPETGAEYVVTSGGRVLYKWRKGEGFEKLGRAASPRTALAIAERRAAKRGMERV